MLDNNLRFWAVGQYITRKQEGIMHILFWGLVLLCIMSIKARIIILFWGTVLGLLLFFKAYFEPTTAFYLGLVLFGVILLWAVYEIIQICRIPDLTWSQKWALMNGRDLPIVQPEEQSAYEKYKESFNDAEKVVKRNQQWFKSKAHNKSAEYELSKGGTKYIRIK